MSRDGHATFGATAGATADATAGATGVTGTSTAAAPGRLLAGRYRVTGLIGIGGMARVYRGTDETLERAIAVKVLKPELAEDEQFVNSFRREAAFGAAVNHPSVASVFDAGRDEGQYFIVMELVLGRTLEELLREQTSFSPDYAVKIAARVCAALGEAHERGLVHGDIKPANLVLTASGQLKVIDFGSALATGAGLNTDPILGTFPYCAPEQAAGEQIDARCDVYALGVVLHRMLTGELPGRGDDTADPPLLTPVHAVARRAMAADPDDRPQSAGELRAELVHALRESPGAARAGDVDLDIDDLDPTRRAIGHTKPLPAGATLRDEPPKTRDLRPAMPLPIRLAAANALVVATALMVVIGLTLQITRTQMQSDLEGRVDAVTRSFENGPARNVAEPGELAEEARGWLAAQASPADQVVAVRTERGEVLTTTGGLSLDQVPNAFGLLSARQSRWWELTGDRTDFLARTVPLVARGRQLGTLVVVAERTESAGVWTGLLLAAGGASLVGLAFATALTFTTVRRTLRPLSRFAREVEAIEGGDLSWRAPEHGPRDEVGRLATAFNRMLSRLEDTVESQRRFVSDASHELRTPLTIAKGQLEMLAQGLDQASDRGDQTTDRTTDQVTGEVTGQADKRQSLSLVDAELDRMGRIVQELLLLARLDEGLPVRREPVEVELVLQEALLRGLRAGLRESTVDVPSDLRVLAERDRMLQVLSNLVTNAVQHAGDDARLRLSAKARGDMVAIEVSDDGRGIPPEDLPRVFDRFYRSRAEPGRTGIGLGLAIAASITRAMGGRISAESRIGRGTTFTVLLPGDTSPPPLQRSSG